ncbi:malonyl-ACP O-methyltransferase BioC [Acinetobacter sp. RF14B]|uniref:malonyl-ACP O-methyltransferase BioC n=1 Tax=Acinetobacter sp. RF14B TaxID=2650965 RepID=UPI0011703271|nr:malonyl-ACP O-methyltransferase BioC [Acinetobacter sp. RF14B]TQR72845.1 malonyl-[acyl-carrier protein] O-methyltransferase BioC [Acinetobacter sp. RF14B]
MKSEQIARRFAQAHLSYKQHAVVQNAVAAELIQLLQQHVSQPDFQRVLEIGCGSGLFSQRFMQSYGFEHLFLNDLYAEVQQHFQEDDRLLWGLGNIETLPLPQSLDLVVSSSSLQWIKDLAALLKKIHQALKASGHVCFSSYAQDNLKEIKALTGQGLDYLSLDQVVRMLKSQGFEVIAQHEERMTLDFEHPKQVLQHIKATGVQATAQGFRWTKSSLQAFYQNYQQFQHPDTQHYGLTYHPIYVIARKVI